MQGESRVLMASGAAVGKVGWGDINRWVGKEVKREKEREERVINRKMKGVVAPQQQLLEFPGQL